MNGAISSPVPFGGGSYADAIRDAGLAWIQSRVSSAFRRWVLCGQRETMNVIIPVPDKSPVPFGGGSYADIELEGKTPTIVE